MHVLLIVIKLKKKKKLKKKRNPRRLENHKVETTNLLQP